MIENVDKMLIDEYESISSPDIAEAVREGYESDDTLVVLGFAEEGEKKGMIAALFEDDGDITIRWLYVLPGYRKQHIAKTLIDAVLRIAAESAQYDDEDIDEQTGPYRIFEAELKLIYAKPESELAGFEEFLKKVGFTDILELEHIMKASSSDIFRLAAFNKPPKEQDNTYGCICVEDLKRKEQEAIVEISEAFPNLEYCFVSGHGENRRTAFIVEDIENSSHPGFKVYGAGRTEEASVDELLMTIRLGLYRMRETYPKGFDLYFERSNEETKDMVLLLGNAVQDELIKKTAFAEIQFCE